MKLVDFNSKLVENQQGKIFLPRGFQSHQNERKKTIFLLAAGLLMACFFVYTLQNPSLVLVTTGDDSLKASPSLTDQLKNLLFLNAGIVSRKDQFVWKKMRCTYVEAQNVTKPYVSWSDRLEYNYLFEVNNGELDSPPSGMRSSVPHGGISTGVFEVRADGTFHEWTIFNQHPGGSAKIQIMDEMFMGIRTQENIKNGQTLSKIMQTHPTSSLPQSSVWALEYRGSYPVSKLTVSDPELPVDVSVYIYHWYKHGDMNTSATPAVAFTAVLTNTNDTTAFNASFLMNLPLGVEPHTQRSFPQMPKLVPIFVNGGKSEDEITYDDIQNQLPRGSSKEYKLGGLTEPEMVMRCFNACSADSDCLSWSLDASKGACLNHKQHVLLNGHQDGFYSGIKTHWSMDAECLTVNRDTPEYNTNGNMSLCAYSSDKNFTVSMGAGDDISSMWSDFTSSGQIPRMPDGPHVTGMVAGQVTLAPNETKEVTIVLGWYFPDRDFLGIPVGNYYSHFFKNSSHAARFLGKNLQNAIADASKLQSTFFYSNVPPTLQDMLINSLSHIRSAFWLKDGRWRQWEALDCTNMDSVHNDGERHIPYIMIFPDSLMNKMRAWASFQQPNGMIREQLRCGCTKFSIKPVTVEYGCGRAMSDVSSMFIVYLLELLQWHPDPATNDFVKEIWPYAKKAAQWHLNISREGNGIPKYLVSTYDVLHMIAYPYTSYNGAFHLLAMKAALKLAIWMNDTDFAAECGEAFTTGQDAMDRLLWNSTYKYYNAYVTTKDEFDIDGFLKSAQINLCSYPEYYREEWGTCYKGYPTTPGAIMTDTFYAQVLAYSLGLGTLVKDVNKLKSHLSKEREMSDTNKGMIALTGRYTGPIVPPSDHAIWMMGDANWATLSIHLGEDVNVAVKELLEPFDYWRVGLNDIWNVAGIMSSGNYTTEPGSFPWTTSHYGFYMSSWHIIFALSGQFVDVNEKVISFSPKMKVPFKLPVMIPTVWGSLQSEVVNRTHVMYTLAVKFGELEFERLTVGNCAYTGNKQIVEASTPVQWYCQ